jgi:hypothetical protein
MGVVVDVEVPARTRADAGEKPQPRGGSRNGAVSATGMSNGSVNFKAVLRVERANAPGVEASDFDFRVNVTRVTCALSVVADPVFASTN